MLMLRSQCPNDQITNFQDWSKDSIYLPSIVRARAEFRNDKTVSDTGEFEGGGEGLMPSPPLTIAPLIVRTPQVLKL